MLEVQNLSMRFGGLLAVDQVSLDVQEHEIVSIIGPNGAGKTTVLDLICGKTKATSGSIKFDGKELTRLKEHQIVHSGVGRKFQTPSVFEDLTVFENLEVSYPQGHSVMGALAFKRSAEVVAAVMAAVMAAVRAVVWAVAGSRAATRVACHMV